MLWRGQYAILFGPMTLPWQNIPTWCRLSLIGPGGIVGKGVQSLLCVLENCF